MSNVKDERVMIKIFASISHEKGWPKTAEQCLSESKKELLEFRRLSNGEVVMFDLLFGFSYREDDFNQEISKIEGVVLPQYAEIISTALIKDSGS